MDCHVRENTKITQHGLKAETILISLDVRHYSEENEEVQMKSSFLLLIYVPLKRERKREKEELSRAS